MKKILASLGATFLVTTTSLVVISKSDGNPYLEITYDDMRDTNGIPGNKDKLDTLAFFFIYELPDNEKPQVSIDRFHWSWNWELVKSNTKAIGKNSAWFSSEYKREHWKIVIQKTKDKGIFVSEYQKSYDEI
ncbi:MAG: hypothetical protein REH79_00555 [Spiroplasma sp.]|nr:hypothetical protein [Spiroplasma sp.]